MVIQEALTEAEFKLRKRLYQTVCKELEYVAEQVGHIRHANDNGDGDLHAFRRAVLKRLESFRSSVTDAEKKIEKALTDYDTNVRELDVWLTAARANEKLRP